jgi:hypothetical protein
MTSKNMGVADIQLTDNRTEHRFEASVEGSLAGFADYQETNGRLVFTHTEVDPASSGQGVGGALARYGLDEARRQHLRVVPICSFIARWIERHPDYADLVDRNAPHA